MKTTIYATSLLFLCGTANAQQGAQNGMSSLNGPVLVFANHDSVYDFGGIPKGTSVDYEFEIRNAGNVPLIIGGMKCASPDVKCKGPVKPIKPGKKGFITVTYTANGDEGSFRPIDISITSNAMISETPVIRITGAIIPASSPYTPSPKTPNKGVHVKAEAVPNNHLPGQ